MLLGIFIFACGNKNTEPALPPVGWYQEEGWIHSCYHLPDYNSMLPTDRSEARENALTAMLEQWNGKRGDGVSFTPEVKPPAKKTIKQNQHQNIFSYFDQCDECDDESNDDCMIYDIKNIIWGVGQKDMIGVKWADVC